MKRTAPKIAVPNFARDTRPQVRLLAGALGFVGALALTGAAALLADRAQLKEQAADKHMLGARLAEKAAALRGKAASVPPPSEFRKLRDRIVALNRLDFDAGVSVGGLLDELEAVLPDQVVVTSLGYDRTARSVDLAAVSVSSADLTSFFDVLDKSRLFSQVRLVDKMQIEAQGGVQTQVRMYLTVGTPPGRARKESRS